jgi:hypothetical protein
MLRHALAASVSLAIVGACSFPDVTYAPSDASPGHDAGHDADATAQDEGGVEAGLIDGTLIDAQPPRDARPPVDTGPDVDAAVCDFDDDFFLAVGGVCGGDDCDDHDNQTWPAEPNYYTKTPSTTNAIQGDYNCNTIVEKLRPINAACPLTAGAACDQTAGFTGDPACGATGDYITCASSGALCPTTHVTGVIQGCK